MLGIYPANYHEARDLFRQAAQDLGAHLENHVVLSGAEYGGDLTIDVAVVGVEDPTWSLVVSSGLHGVEGFFGSALQTAYLRQVQRQDVIDSKGQLVLIHAINPLGFLHYGASTKTTSISIGIFSLPARHTVARRSYTRISMVS